MTFLRVKKKGTHNIKFHVRNVAVLEFIVWKPQIYILHSSKTSLCCKNFLLPSYIDLLFRKFLMNTYMALSQSIFCTLPKNYFTNFVSCHNLRKRCHCSYKTIVFDVCVPHNFHKTRKFIFKNDNNECFEALDVQNYSFH